MPRRRRDRRTHNGPFGRNRRPSAGPASAVGRCEQVPPPGPNAPPGSRRAAMPPARRRKRARLGDQHRDRYPGNREADQRDRVAAACRRPGQNWRREEKNSRDDGEHHCGERWPYAADDRDRDDQQKRGKHQEPALDQSRVHAAAQPESAARGQRQPRATPPPGAQAAAASPTRWSDRPARSPHRG